MKVVQIYNRHRFGGGLDIVAKTTIDILRKRGITVIPFIRDSSEIRNNLLGKVHAFLCGIFSLSAFREMSQIIRRERPDIAHVHNLFPLLSPSVLVACRHGNVPIVMTCHDYSLTCPTYHHLYKDKVCNKCCGGREYWCIIQNCRNHFWESVAYTAKSFVARKWKVYEDNVSAFIAPSEFVKAHLIANNATLKPIAVLPNTVGTPDANTESADRGYIAYAGRMSPEKGIDTLIAAARKLPKLSFQLAGNPSSMPDLIRTAPRNIAFIGQLEENQMVEFYRGARIVVVPSKCTESFGMVAAEAMSHGRPVIASRTGGLLEVVEDGLTGLFFEPGSIDDLSIKIDFLWERPELCRKMGREGRAKALRKFSEDVFFDRLMAVYNQAIRGNQQSSG